ncbi:MAG: MMPL family transporter, partial [Bacteroidales bacterium]|nr:MMPL family transporter [Bacteroidales bacterium]
SLPDNDPDAALLKRISEKFGGNSMGVIILETDDIYQTEVLEHVRSITDTLNFIEGISSVSSLTNIINIKGGDVGIEIGQLVDEYELPETPEEFKILRNNVLSNEMYKGSIVSDDGTATLIIFTLEDGANVNAVAKSVISKTEALHLPEKLYYIGSPMLVTYISDLMKSDLVRLLPFAFLLIAIILFLSFRSASGVILPLLTAVLSIIWSLGIMSLLGYKMSMISNNIPIILLAVGTAYTIHVLNRINQLRTTDRDKAISKALAYVMIPVMLAAITTIIGFVSFIFGAYLDMIVDFGIFTALGTFFACLLSIFFVPALLDIFTSKKRNKDLISKKVKKSFLSENFLSPLKFLLFKHPKYVLTTWSILILISVVGVFFIERSVDIQEYFKKGNPTREAESIMVKKFGGVKPVFVLFTGDMQSPEVLKKMILTGEYMEMSPDIHTTQSIADLIAEIYFAIAGTREIPDEQEIIEQLWFLLDGNDVMQRFVSEDLDEGIIISKFKSPDNEAKMEFARYMETFIKENSTEDCQIEITGMPFVDITMDRSLINSQLGSITIAIIFVIIIVGLIMRSLYNGMYASIPIIAAIIILFGVMGLTGISLNIATVLVASVALGIGIDYSIHIISHFNHTYQITSNAKIAIEDTIMISGKAIIINVISVSAGFLILIFSEMVPLQYFGFLIALSMLGSSFGALTLLPVILILVHRKKNNDHFNLNQ